MSPLELPEVARARMVADLRIQDPRVSAALLRVPRHEFLPAEFLAQAYDDEPVPLGAEEATISAPHMVALMLEEIQPEPGEHMLEVGTGMGYFAALLAEMVAPDGHIDTTEVEPRLVEESRRRLRSTGYGDRVRVHARDGALGLPDGAPFDAIAVSCAAPSLLPTWTGQLGDHGRLVAPIGDATRQALTTYRKGPGAPTVRRGPWCRFVSMRTSPVPHI